MATYSQEIFDLNKEIEESKNNLEFSLRELGEQAIRLGYCPNDSKSNTTYTQILAIEADIVKLEKQRSELKIAEDKYHSLVESEKETKISIKKVENNIFENNQNIGSFSYELYKNNDLNEDLFYDDIIELEDLINKKAEIEDKTNKGGLSNMVHSLVSKRKLSTIKQSILDHFSLWGASIVVSHYKLAKLERKYELYELYSNEMKTLENKLNKSKKEMIILQSNYPFLLKDTSSTYDIIDNKKDKLLESLNQSYISFGRILSTMVCDIPDQQLKEQHAQVRILHNNYESLKTQRGKYEFMEKKGEASVILNKKKVHLEYLLENKKDIERQIIQLKREIEEISESFFNEDHSE